MKSIKETISEAIKHGLSQRQLRRKKQGRPVYEGSEQVVESIKNGEDAIDMIVACLDNHDALYDICDAADKGKFRVESFVDDYGKQILEKLNSALVECWNENF